MADTMKQLYITYAASLGLGDLTRVKTGPERSALITKIADMYCEATDMKNEGRRNATISALMLLFYGEINKMQDKCKAVKELDYDDYASKLYECINIACQYRAWKDGKHNAEQCIRATIASRGAAAILYESNLDKNKANVNNFCLDATVSDDDKTTNIDLIADEDSISAELAARGMIQAVINTGDVISGIILDNLAFNDSYKSVKETKVGEDLETGETYKYTISKSEFSKQYLVRALNNLDDKYLSYFLNRYDVKEAALQAAYSRIKSVNNTCLYKFVNNATQNHKALFQN